MGMIASALRMVFPRYPVRQFMLARLGDERDYGTLVGDGTGSPLVDAIVSFIIHGFTQMYPVIAISEANQVDSVQLDAAHPAAVLFRRPTYDPDLGRSWYSWMTMIAGLMVSFIADGNAYLIKVRSGSGKVVQLWYAPHFMLEPRWDLEDPTVFIAGYDYSPSGGKLSPGPQRTAPIDGRGPVYWIDVKDVIHIRDGLDPMNPRKGSAKLKKLLREIYTDEEAARFTASMLRNHGVPGLVISPAVSEKGGWIADKDDAEEVKQRMRGDFSGDNRGLPIVMRGPTQVSSYGFSPEQMMLRHIRAIPEERVSAALGIPAAVVGFGAGLERTKVGKTMEEFVDLAWQNGILPKARIVAAELTEQLLPEFEPVGASQKVDFAFDTSRVPIMATYHKLQAERHEILMRASIEDRGEARRAVGLPASARDRAFQLQSGNLEVPSDKSLDESPTPAPTFGGPGVASPPPKPGDPEPLPADEDDDEEATLPIREDEEVVT